MKKKSQKYSRLSELRQRELQVALKPCAEAYISLAKEYLAIGLSKEYDRLLQKAESIENGGRPRDPHGSEALLSGTNNPAMLIEVIQTLSRTPASGDLVIVTPAQSYHIYFHEGWIISAMSQDYPSGIASLRRALSTTSGTYGFFEKDVSNVERVIFDSTDILLLNVLQHADETKP